MVLTFNKKNLSELTISESAKTDLSIRFPAENIVKTNYNWYKGSRNRGLR